EPPFPPLPPTDWASMPMAPSPFVFTLFTLTITVLALLFPELVTDPPTENKPDAEPAVPPPPPIDCAMTPIAESPLVDTFDAPVMVTVSPYPPAPPAPPSATMESAIAPAPPLPPMDCATMPWAYCPLVEMVAEESIVTAAPLPPLPPLPLPPGRLLVKSSPAPPPPPMDCASIPIERVPAVVTALFVSAVI